MARGMEQSLNLRAEKQEKLINAALTVFSRNGYKKASVADIANEAGIAKGMINYYFGSKKNLYLYLCEICIKELTEEVSKHFDQNVTDFFDRLKMLIDVKRAAMRKYPSLSTFLISFYLETDPAVREDIKEYISEGLKIQRKWLGNETDISKFKPGVNPQILDRVIFWASEGMASNLVKSESQELLDEKIDVFYDFLDMMKRHLYQEKYIT